MILSGAYNIASLTKNALLAVFSLITPKYSTELSTESVDNGNLSSSDIHLSVLQEKIHQLWPVIAIHAKNHD
uniref:Uncharacterized protein n=1 Tax=Candidatus Kentrum sp. SD TaxID=2126332 RepID=A0A450YGQ4_9GAMM|nr:MAG: hypothetical protein BECKSD772F_GA0070984_106513 [Candidatus Kentron sp. SD]VFK45803.1 MAG: hypothetical protein BECKSD772E_GA0070983_106015 [Candidatus Kentron sp. SD]